MKTFNPEQEEFDNAVNQLTHKTKRNAILTALVSLYYRNKIRQNYNVELGGMDNLKMLKGYGSVVISPHQLDFDIPLLDTVLYNGMKEHGFYAMKKSLDPRYQYVGGEFIPRKADLDNVPKEQKRQALVNMMKELDYFFNETMPSGLYRSKKPFVFFASGHRTFQEEQEVPLSTLNRLTDMFKKFGPVPVVAVDIEYVNKEKGSQPIYNAEKDKFEPPELEKIIVHANSPIVTLDSPYLQKYLTDHIKLFVPGNNDKNGGNGKLSSK